MSSQPKPIKVNTPDGTIVVNESTVDPTPQKIQVITGSELARLQKLGSDAPDFLAKYLPNTPTADLKDYDRAFRAWQVSSSRQHTDEEVVQILGGYLGNKCVTDLDMEWVKVTDEYGTDYAVRSKTVEAMGFPFSTVLKRVEDKKYDFLHGVYYTIKDRIDKSKPQQEENRSN
ncbi:MAG: DUF3806 domain-containing protein [Pirellulaceae bacterium]